MSEPIKWSGDGCATVDGVPLSSFSNQRTVWTVMQRYTHEAICVNADRDLAARAVVAAVRVMRGER